jgi:hypothetical protein
MIIGFHPFTMKLQSSTLRAHHDDELGDGHSAPLLSAPWVLVLLRRCRLLKGASPGRERATNRWRPCR